MPAVFTTTAVGEAPTGTVASTVLSARLTTVIVPLVALVTYALPPNTATPDGDAPVPTAPVTTRFCCSTPAGNASAEKVVASAPTSSVVSAEVRNRLPAVSGSVLGSNWRRAAAASAT